jgi:5-methylcytosine-specific restriction protein A
MRNKRNSVLVKNLENLKNDFYKNGGTITRITPTESSLCHNFYRSSEWKELRNKFILEYNGGRCFNCTVEWNTVNESNLNVDHIQPLKFYWERRLDITNLQLLCESCNRFKGSATYSTVDERMYIAFEFKDHQMKELADSQIFQEKLALWELNVKQLNKIANDFATHAKLFKHTDRFNYHKYNTLREEATRIAHRKTVKE